MLTVACGLSFGKEPQGRNVMSHYNMTFSSTAQMVNRHITDNIAEGLAAQRSGKCSTHRSLFVTTILEPPFHVLEVPLRYVNDEVNAVMYSRRQIIGLEETDNSRKGRNFIRTSGDQHLSEL